MGEGVRAPYGKAKKRIALAVLAVVVIVVLSVISIWADHRSRGGPLSRVDGGMEYKVKDLTGGFYRSWDYVWVSIFSGESHSEGNDVVYPISVSWRLNSSMLSAAGPKVCDFGGRNIGGAWFNLTVRDLGGDGKVSDGDCLTVTSSNGSFARNTDYFLDFTARTMLNSGIAPFYTVLGFRYSMLGFDSWVEAEPNEYAW